MREFVGNRVVFKEALFDENLKQCAGVLIWGNVSCNKQESFAREHRLPLWRLEPGFLQFGTLEKKSPVLSLVLDDLGRYYDAGKPSRLETSIATRLSEPQRRRAQALIQAWRRARLSQFNACRDYAGKLPERYVLVVDQMNADASIRPGWADKSSFQKMLDAALDEYPDCCVIVASVQGENEKKRPGCLDRCDSLNHPRVRAVSGEIHPASLIEKAAAVYTVTSVIGFEALIWDKKVRVFGMPFYAGWGLTVDESAPPARRKPVPLENLVHAALIDRSRYVDPETGKACEIERLIDWLQLQRRMRERFPSRLYALGFSYYKRPIVRSFFQGSEVRFCRDAANIPENAPIAYWSRNYEDVAARRKTNPVIRLEDGFIRSVGLGADLIRPLSWVMDRRGMYFDATEPSDLEILLKTAEFEESLLRRARRLRERMVAESLTKYNVGIGNWSLPEELKSAVRSRVILVPGQVEADASLAYGATGVKRNIDLLRCVRENNSNGYVIYKPHPDVVAGLRHSGRDEENANDWCDEVVIDVSMGELLPLVDEVHTLTSLTGFEALLRGKKVVCYGQPFYSGWGLTEDIRPVSRRGRDLALDELVAGVLILYPTYVSRTTGRFTTPERALDELLAWREEQSGPMPRWRRVLRWYLQLTKPS